MISSGKKRFSDLDNVQIGDYRPRNISSGGFNNIEESLRTCFCYTTRWYFESYQCKNSGWKQGLRTMFASAAAAVCSRRRYTLSAKTGNWIWRTIFKNSEWKWKKFLWNLKWLYHHVNEQPLTALRRPDLQNSLKRAKLVRWSVGGDGHLQRIWRWPSK